MNIFGNNGDSFTKSGNSYFGNNGNSIHNVGGFTTDLKGRHMTTMDNASYMSNGVNILKSGNTYYASNGKSYTLMENALYA